MLDNTRKITNNDYIVTNVKFSMGKHSNRIYTWHFCILIYPIVGGYVSFITKLFSLCGCIFRNSFDFNCIISSTWVVAPLHVLDDTSTWLVGCVLLPRLFFVDLFLESHTMHPKLTIIETISIGICRWFSLTKGLA